MRKTIFAFTIFLVPFFACVDRKPAAMMGDLIEADKDFSRLSVDSGFAKAFIQYAHPDAVLLRKNSMPVKGKEEIASLYQKSIGSGARLTWEPIDGNIAASGEIGYTYGIYTLQIDSVTEKGTYVTVWKKDEEGSWKYILDTGNEGLGPNPN